MWADTGPFAIKALNKIKKNLTNLWIRFFKCTVDLDFGIFKFLFPVNVLIHGCHLVYKSTLPAVVMVNIMTITIIIINTIPHHHV